MLMQVVCTIYMYAVEVGLLCVCVCVHARILFKCVFLGARVNYYDNRVNWWLFSYNLEKYDGIILAPSRLQLLITRLYYIIQVRIIVRIIKRILFSFPSRHRGRRVRRNNKYHDSDIYNIFTDIKMCSNCPRRMHNQ